MGWQPELDELREREELRARLGGADKIKRQHDAGKLTSANASTAWSIAAASMRSARSPAAPSTMPRASWTSWCRRIA